MRLRVVDFQFARVDKFEHVPFAIMHGMLLVLVSPHAPAIVVFVQMGLHIFAQLCLHLLFLFACPVCMVCAVDLHTSAQFHRILISLSVLDVKIFAGQLSWHLVC